MRRECTASAQTTLYHRSRNLINRDRLGIRSTASQDPQKVGIFPSRILLSIDGSEEAELATRKPMDLAGGIGSELHVVYVGQLPNFLMNDPDTKGFNRKLCDDIGRESR
jgi:hypothetical protein